MAIKRFILSIALLLPFTIQAQNHHEIGVAFGVSNYYGDLQQKLFPNYGYKPMAGIQYKYFMNPHIGLRFGASYSSISAADSLSDNPTYQKRNLSFASNIFEFHGGLELNFLPIEADRYKVTPYIFAGIAAFYSNPYALTGKGEKIFLKPLGTEGQGMAQYPNRKEYNLVQAAFPIGGGFKFFIGKTVMVTTELGFRYTTTDYLDDVSTTYVNLDSLGAVRGQVSTEMSFRGNTASDFDKLHGNYPDYKFQRGDASRNDWYWYGNISVSIYFRAFGNLKNYWQTNCPNFLR